jgi:hypothetical protein
MKALTFADLISSKRVPTKPHSLATGEVVTLHGLTASELVAWRERWSQVHIAESGEQIDPKEVERRMMEQDGLLAVRFLAGPDHTATLDDAQALRARLSNADLINVIRSGIDFSSVLPEHQVDAEKKSDATTSGAPT